MYFHVPGTRPGLALLYDFVADTVKDLRMKRSDEKAGSKSDSQVGSKSDSKADGKAGSKSDDKVGDKADDLSLYFFEKIDLEALYSAIDVVSKDNNVDLQITGLRVKEGGKKLEIFVDISEESSRTKLKQEINQEYDAETQKRKDNGTTNFFNFLHIEKLVQNSQMNLSGANGQIDGGNTHMSTNFENNLSGANVANFANQVSGNARQQADQHIDQFERKKTLSEAAAEIQKLLEQLEKSHPTATEIEKVLYVNDETTPSFKRRIVGALGAGGEAAIEEFLDNSYLNIGKAIIKGWIKPG